MVLNSKAALVAAVATARKPMAFLVGSPLSTAGGRGVPGIGSILEIVREVVHLELPTEIQRYDQEIQGKSGCLAYQAAMGWVQANIHQDAINKVVRRAVLKSCTQVSTVGDLSNPNSDGEPEHWFIPKGTLDLAKLVCTSDPRFSGPIITTNFDPLLSLAIKSLGQIPSLRVFDSDGALPRDVEKSPQTRDVYHLHGFWRGTDTLHTPSQLGTPRLKLKASLQRLLRNHVLVVVAYGGWDDVFTSALAELLHDSDAEVEVIWCFYTDKIGIVKEENIALLSNMQPAIIKGRFRTYGGIDCHSIFDEIYARIKPIEVNSAQRTESSDSTPVGQTFEQRKPSNNDFVDRYFSKRLDDALVSFSSQPKVWVEPTVCKTSETSVNTDNLEKIALTELISSPRSTIIKAPPQFGLTCLGLYLTREAWRQCNCPWAFLDAKSVKSNKASIEQAVEAEARLLGFEMNDITCIVLDSWASHEKDAQKLLRKLCERFPHVPIIVLQTLDESQFFAAHDEEMERDFEVLFLWALPRGHVRKVVSEYNEVKHIGDEDKVTTKVVSDLEVLNLHRTPFNCLTLLKVSEIDFDESPVNRSEMIKRVLFLLFNMDDIPTYKTRPDLKDSEYVLGYFCEIMLRKSSYTFTREYFLEVLDRCCKEKFIDLEVQVVFDVLYLNNIIIKVGNFFKFRFTFWIYYFAAQRMIHSPDFAAFIYEDMRYANFPEILEFYTGIDRHRHDALEVLTKDIKSACDKLKNKVGIPEELNPYRLAQWTPSEKQRDLMHHEISDGVSSSNLPASVKDHYADQQYDRAKPYDQDVRSLLAEYSFISMVQAMRGGARALRNSDYVDPSIKRELLKEIMGCWDQVSKVLLVLAPLLAQKGSARFDGTGFYLVGDFGETPQDRFYRILNEIPANVVKWYEEDLYSQKMGPLLINEARNSFSDITKHELVLLLINQRPRGWKAEVEHYISAIEPNSFYLWSVYTMLRAQYRFAYAPQKTLAEIEFLIKMSAAKHLTGTKKPSAKLINKVLDAIPQREIEGTFIGT